MTLIQVLLILGAALGFVTLDLLRKVLAERMRLVPLLFWMTAGVIPLYAVWAITSGARAPTAEYWVPALASIGLNVAANLMYLRAVHVGELSRTIPLLSLTPVLTAVFAVPMLQEVPTGKQVLGIILVVVGAVLLQIGAAPDADERASGSDVGKGTGLAVGPRSWWHRMPRSAWLMLAVACLWSATTPLDKLALRSASVPVHALVLHIGIASCMLVWLLFRRQQAQLRLARSAQWLLCAAVVVAAVALGCQLLALELVYAALLETMKRGLGGIAALGFGYVLFRERITFAKSASVAIMVAGVGMLMF